MLESSCVHQSAVSPTKVCAKPCPSWHSDKRPHLLQKQHIAPTLKAYPRAQAPEASPSCTGAYLPTPLERADQQALRSKSSMVFFCKQQSCMTPMTSTPHFSDSLSHNLGFGNSEVIHVRLIKHATIDCRYALEQMSNVSGRGVHEPIGIQTLISLPQHAQT